MSFLGWLLAYCDGRLQMVSRTIINNFYYNFCTMALTNTELGLILGLCLGETSLFFIFFLEMISSYFCSSKAFFILAGCGIKYLYERRLASRLQNELNGFLYDYIALEGNEIETINFINEMSRMDSKGKSSDM